MGPLASGSFQEPERVLLGLEFADLTVVLAGVDRHGALDPGHLVKVFEFAAQLVVLRANNGPPIQTRSTSGRCTNGKRTSRRSVSM